MAERMLEKRVVVDRECVTYRLLSRLLNVHVNEAKRQLQLFHDGDKHKTHATYIVAGRLRPAPPPANGHDRTAALTSEADEMEVDEKPAVEVETIQRTAFELVQEEELEECKTRFAQVSNVYVYSVQPKRLFDISLVCAANATILTDDRCKMNVAASKNGKAFGVIQLPPRKTVASGNKKPAPPSSPPQRPAAGPSKKAESATKAKTETKPASSSSTKRKAEPAPVPVKAGATGDGKGKGKAVEPSSDGLGMDWDAAAEEEMMKMEREAMGVDESMDVDAGEKKATPQAEKKRVRKKRVVKKTVRDAKGNRRTEEVEESYSEDEDAAPKRSSPSTSNAAPAAKKPPPANVNASKKPGPAAPPAKKAAPADASGQTSLKNFFAPPKKGKK